ncbi:MAG: hypothetical protein AAFQ09_07705 [Pseudomonadota bacterium]
MYKYIFLGLGAFALVGCELSASSQAVDDATIDETFVPLSLNWQNGPTIDYRVGIFEEQGAYIVCAAAKNVRAIEDRQILNAVRLTVNDDTLIRGLEWARIYPGGQELDGQAAACRKTDVAVVEDPEFDIELTRTTFIRNRF